jgi:hypothetical protein
MTATIVIHPLDMKLNGFFMGTTLHWIYAFDIAASAGAASMRPHSSVILGRALQRFADQM